MKNKKNDYYFFSKRTGILLIVAVFLFICGAGSFITHDLQSDIAPTPTSYPTMRPSPTKIPPPEKKEFVYKLALYQPNSTKPQFFAEFPIKENGRYGTVRPIRDGNDVYLSDGYTVTRYALREGTSQTIFTNTTQRIITHMTLTNTGYLYLSLAPTSEEYFKEDSSFVIVAIEKDSGKTIRTLSPLFYKLYGLKEYLFTAGETDIIYTHSGDGCGGAGSISQFQQGKEQAIATFGMGCADGPRYIGFREETQQILMAHLLRPPYLKNDLFEEEFDVLYGQDVITGEVTPIYDLTKIPGLKKIILNEKKDTVIFVTQDTVSLLNVSTKTIIKTISLRLTSMYGLRADDDELISVDRPEDEMTIVNLYTGQVTKQPAQGIELMSSNVLGKWENRYLFLLLEEK